MKKTLSLLGILTIPLLLMACDTVTVTPFVSPNPTVQAISQDSFATRSALEVDLAQSAAQATQQAMSLQATLQAQERQLAILRAEETRRAQATFSALELTRQAAELQLTREAWHVQLTVTERAFQLTATEQAQRDMLTQTALAWNNQLTADAYYQARQETATAQHVQGTRTAEHATATRQAERREEVLAYGRDFGLPLILLALLVCGILLLIYGIQWWMRRPVPFNRDFRGDARPFFIPTRDGKYVLVDLDRQPGPAMIVHPDGTVEAPQLRPAGQEERTTARDQVVDLTTRPRLGGPGTRGHQPILPLAPPPSPMQGIRRVAVLRRLDQAAAAGMLPPTLVATLEEDWRSDDDGE
ncbi:MAG: hypothetical protein N2556_06275 [Anaerolineae bacterium]|nr:hypothetical protein [Anaerolineae bacterium]